MNFKLNTFNIDINVSRLANIHYFEFTNNYHTKQDSHNFCELIYVDNGSINVIGENFIGILKKNQMIIHQSNEKHSLFCDKNSVPNIIIIGFECKSTKLDYFSKNKVTLSKQLQKQLVDVVKEGRQVFLPPYDIPNLKNMQKRDNYIYGSDQLIKILLERFLINIIRENEMKLSINNDLDITERNLYEIKAYIDANYLKTISLEELCFLFGTNKTTLCKEFKDNVGLTIIQYINYLKIETAKLKIREETKTLTQIADELNFSSVHYLSSLFKKHENLSPSEYLNSIKSKLDNN